MSSSGWLRTLNSTLRNVNGIRQVTNFDHFLLYYSEENVITDPFMTVTITPVLHKVPPGRAESHLLCTAGTRHETTRILCVNNMACCAVLLRSCVTGFVFSTPHFLKIIQNPVETYVSRLISDLDSCFYCFGLS